jgi:hypothetical protein
MYSDKTVCDKVILNKICFITGNILTNHVVANTCKRFCFPYRKHGGLGALREQEERPGRQAGRRGEGAPGHQEGQPVVIHVSPKFLAADFC